jgi:cbb3-type cytochrome oxidase maturation protein
MSVIYIVLPVALLLAAGFVFAFIWGTRRGQFDDMETPRWRMLFDDTPVKPTPPATKAEKPKSELENR